MEWPEGCLAVPACGRCLLPSGSEQWAQSTREKGMEEERGCWHHVSKDVEVWLVCKRGRARVRGMPGWECLGEVGFGQRHHACARRSRVRGAVGERAGKGSSFSSGLYFSPLCAAPTAPL